MKIGFLGGSFDPIHFGHINLAIELKEKAGLDEVWFCPANINPHKGNNPPLADPLRFQMVQLAIEDIPYFKVIDNEIKRSGASYTVQTLRELNEQFPQHEWYLLLGDDCLDSFFKWKEPDEILKLASPLIGSRNTADFLEIKNGTSDRRKMFASCGMHIPILEISSTIVRKRLSKGLYCGHLLPTKVLDFIIENGLYS